MKKIFLGLLITLLILATACSDKGSSDANLGIEESDLEEQQAQDDFREESNIDINKDTAYEDIPAELLARCATPFPDDAEKLGFSDSVYWQRISTSKKVGPFMKWVYGTDREVKNWFYCFNLEGEEHGPRIEWYKNGEIKQHCELKNHKLVTCEFFCENGQMNAQNFYDEDGKTHGIAYRWNCDGTPKPSDRYEHGSWKGTVK
ncbi:MAG: hypothetical protein U9R08_03225 [Nanoarchaeota archaeon]|nr:hypothetical protein [Nanoarchaeota archaeon]